MKTAEDFRFEFGHIGIWFPTAEEAKQALDFFVANFEFDVDPTSFGWNIDNNHIELISGPGRGTKGHFSILCDDIEGAKAYLESLGVAFLDDAQYTADGKLWKIWARDEISGFAWHLALRGKASEGRAEQTVRDGEALTAAKDFNFDFGHIGIWHEKEEEAKEFADKLINWFGFDVEEVPWAYHINNNHFEILKEPGRGVKGHFSILCDHIDEAKAYLESRGVVFDENTCHYTADGQLWKVFAHNSISDFDWHLALRGRASNGH